MHNASRYLTTGSRNVTSLFIITNLRVKDSESLGAAPNPVKLAYKGDAHKQIISYAHGYQWHPEEDGPDFF